MPADPANAAPPLGISRFDSATAMLQALAAHLHGHPFGSLSGSRASDRLLKFGNGLPQRVRTLAYSLAALNEAAPRRRAGDIDAERTAEWACSLYPARRYPAIFIGSSNGAMIHLCAAMGVPWLPQTYLALVRQLFTDPNDPAEGLRRGVPMSEAIAASNPGIDVHQMHDPSQDHLMLKSVGYFRLKLRRLPAAYRHFIANCLAPGGTIYIVDCTATWPVVDLGERRFFQTGGIGGTSEDEYFDGGPRVAQFLSRLGDRRKRWSPPRPTRRAPEAEWGFDQCMLPEISMLAGDGGFSVRHIRHRHPTDLAPVAADIFAHWYRELGIAPQRLLVETFVMIEPHHALRLRAVPLWLTFNDLPSQQSALAYLQARPAAFDDIRLALFSHGTDGIGLATASDWQAVLSHANCSGEFLGVDAEKYPSDFATLARYQDALSSLPVLPGTLPNMNAGFFERTLSRMMPEFDRSAASAD